MTHSSSTRQPWWNRTAVYVGMVLVVAAVEVFSRTSPHGRQPSPMAEEQRLLEQLDARLNPVTTVAAAVQRPLLACLAVLALLLGLAAWMAGWVLMVRWLHRSRVLPTRLGSVTAWSTGDIARIVIVALFAAHLLPLAQVALYAVARRAVGDMHGWLLVSMGAVDGSALLWIVALAREQARGWAATIGWTARHGWRRMRQGFMTYLGILPALSLAVSIAVGLAASFNYTEPPEPLMGLFLNESRWPVLALVTLFACVLGPLAEETFFRGVVYPALRRRWGVRWSVLISGGCFAALHGNLIGFLPIWLLGITLACVYEATGSLVAPLALHMLHNTILITGVWFTKAFLGAAGP